MSAAQTTKGPFTLFCCTFSFDDMCNLFRVNSIKVLAVTASIHLSISRKEDMYITIVHETLRNVLTPNDVSCLITSELKTCNLKKKGCHQEMFCLHAPFCYNQRNCSRTIMCTGAWLSMLYGRKLLSPLCKRRM